MALSHRHICWKGNSLKKGTIFQSEPAIFHTQNTFLRDIFMASLNGLWKEKKRIGTEDSSQSVQSKSRCGSNAWRNKVEMGQIAKSRQKLSRKIREIDWSYLLMSFNSLTNFENKGRVITGNGNVGWKSNFKSREITASKLKWIYFWRVLDIWKPALSFGEEVPQSRKGNGFYYFDNRVS